MPPGMPTVLIEGVPAAVAPAMAACTVPHGPSPLPPAPLVPTPMVKPVLIGGRPAACMGDKLPCGAAVVGGSATVRIGG
ncbi:PAAR domain-containing protein [Streptomyces sp. AV19]|uniref:PAAR domain-containing protein n=1 Tax=Streptomyces sp. AV19 TaxID=2793068 RepID=UPI002277BD95|nr:PAAR domain-containing protein [Streptomyces sp. AV19]MDG4536916.1 PAAR domain-containing protein [Streptomyces sp. AV19]